MRRALGRLLTPVTAAVPLTCGAAHGAVAPGSASSAGVERGGLMLLAITGVLVLLGLVIYMIAKRMK